MNLEPPDWRSSLEEVLRTTHVDDPDDDEDNVRRGKAVRGETRKVA